MRNVAVLTVLLAAPAWPDDNSARDVLEKRCFGCHGEARMSDLDLRQREAALRGGKRGPALEPGNQRQVFFSAWSPAAAN